MNILLFLLYYFAGFLLAIIACTGLGLVIAALLALAKSISRPKNLLLMFLCCCRLCLLRSYPRWVIHRRLDWRSNRPCRSDGHAHRSGFSRYIWSGYYSAVSCCCIEADVWNSSRIEHGHPQYFVVFLTAKVNPMKKILLLPLLLLVTTSVSAQPRRRPTPSQPTTASPSRKVLETVKTSDGREIQYYDDMTYTKSCAPLCRLWPQC